MNRASARHLLVAPALLWAALSATPAVADSCAYATIRTGNGSATVSAVAVAGGGASAAIRGGADHGDGPSEDRRKGQGTGHGGSHGKGHDKGRGKGHGRHHGPPPPPAC
ncbi:hypothetical protein HYE82_30600, partial [Streptomyces sp. BR123]|nr:hypothetical protein [Streptomyces sp. BR123]